MLPIHKPIRLLCCCLLIGWLPAVVQSNSTECPYCELIEATDGTQIIIDKDLPNWQALLESALENILLSAIQPTLINVSPRFLPQGSTANLTITASKDPFVPNAIQQVSVTGLQVNDPAVAILNPRQLVINVTVPPDTAVNTLRDISVVVDGQTVIGTELFYVSPVPTVAQVLSVTPNEMARGTTTTVTLYGQGTAFDDSSQVDFGSGVTATVTAYTPERLTVNVKASDTATIGYRHVAVTTHGVTVTNDAKAVGLLLINASDIAGLPQITQVTPVFGAQGQTLTLELVGKDVAWLAGQTELQLTGIEVLNTTVNSPTMLQAQIRIPENALLGSRDVYAMTGGQTAVRFAGFAVFSPASLSLSTNSALPGQRKILRILGTNTHFKSGVTQLNFDKSGITVSALTVISETELEATLRVAEDADINTQYFVTAVTDQEVAAFEGTFQVLGEATGNAAPTALEVDFIDPLTNDLAPNRVIATLSTQDPDADDTHIYSLVAYSGDLFAITGNQLSVTRTPTAQAYSLLLRTTDAEGLWYQEPINFTVTATDAPPVPPVPPAPANPSPTQPPSTPVPTSAMLSFAYTQGIINNASELLLTVDETSTPTTVYAVRTGEAALQVEIGLGGNAVLGEDYRLLTGTTVSWPANDPTPQPIVLEMLDDLATETTEQIMLTYISVPATGALGNPSVARIQIRDNEEGFPDPDPDPTPVCEAATLTPAEQAISLVAGGSVAVQWAGAITNLPLSNQIAALDLNSWQAIGGLSQIEIAGLQVGSTTLTFSNCASEAIVNVTVTAPPVQPLAESWEYYCALDENISAFCQNADEAPPLINNAFGLDRAREAIEVNATFAIESAPEIGILPFLTEADSLDINGVIKIDDAHYGQPALLFAILTHEPTGTQWSYAQGWQPWESDPAQLGYHQRLSQLPYLVSIDWSLPLADGLAYGLTGDYSWDIGYQLVSDGSLIFNNPWAFANQFRVGNGLSWSMGELPTTADAHFSLAINGEFSAQPRVRMPAQQLEIVATVQPDPAHIGQRADFFVVAAYFSADSAGAYKQLRDGVWIAWDGQPDSLLAERATLTQTEVLRATLTVPVFTGTLQLDAGRLVVYVGYSLQTNEEAIIYNQADALEIVLE